MGRYKHVAIVPKRRKPLPDNYVTLSNVMFILMLLIIIQTVILHWVGYY